MKPKDIITQRGNSTTRVVFIHPYHPEFIQACRALKLRGLVEFAQNPIPIKGIDYKAWFADIKNEALGEETYSKYAMLVRGFYTSDLRAKFDALFDGIKHDSIEAAIHNPSKFMAAQETEVRRLIDKYRNTNSPLEFFGSLHQAEGVALFLQSLKSKDGIKGFINCDAPGLGKTRQAVVAAIEAGMKNILVVTTKTAKTAVWPDQIRMVNPQATITLANHKNYSERAQWTITHWDSLRLCDSRFFDNAKTFDLLILDEMHYASNDKSQRGKAAGKLASNIKHVWGLTGTPVTKRPRNLINLLRLVNHPIVNDENKVWKFLMRYCGEKDEWGRWDFNRAKNIEELHVLLRDVFIRREKDQTNMPEKVRHIRHVILTPEQRDVYERAWETYLEDPEHAEKARQPNYPTEMVQKMVRRHSVAMAKVPHIIEWAEELIDADEKVVIFTAFDEVWEAYAKYFGDKAVGIRGQVKESLRADIVRQFQNDPKIKVFIGNAQTAGEGITLTAASYLAFNDLTWLPKDQLQAEDRIHRGGAKKTCMIYYFLAKDTEDEHAFSDFIKHKDITQRIVNRRDEYGRPIDPGFFSEQNNERAEEKMMKKLARLIDTKSLPARDLSFCESVHNYYLSKGYISEKQANVIQQILQKYQSTLETLEGVV